MAIILVISWYQNSTTHGIKTAPRNQKSAVFSVSWYQNSPTRGGFSLFRGIKTAPLYKLPGSWLPKALENVF